jgi:galactonate dehydratase
MRITGLEVLRLRVNRRGDWVLVRLATDEGLTGLGEASHGGRGPDRDALVVLTLERQCFPILRGRDPCAVIAATAALQGLVEGPAAATAVSACEQALWDLAGKSAGLPVCRMLGGPVRERIPLYANINRAAEERTPTAFAECARSAITAGFHSVKIAPFDGIRQRYLREPEQRELLARGVACVAAVRDAVGPSVDVKVDCHGRFDVPTAVEMARELRALGVTWFEEPVPTDDLEALQRLRPFVLDAGMELVGGERLYGVEGFRPYLAAGVWAVIMPDVKHCGGIAAMLHIGAAAYGRSVAVSPHNPSGPVACVASAHAVACLPHARALEYAWGEVPWRADIITPAERIEAGELVLPMLPGLGIALDEARLSECRREP